MCCYRAKTFEIQMRGAKRQKEKQKRNIENVVQTEDVKDNLAVFLTVMILPMQAETGLIKLTRLPLVSSKQQQTISTKLLNKESIK